MIVKMLVSFLCVRKLVNVKQRAFCEKSGYERDLRRERERDGEMDGWISG